MPTLEVELAVICSLRSLPTSLFQSFGVCSLICCAPAVSSKRSSLKVPPPGLVSVLKVLTVGTTVEGWFWPL